MFTFHVDLGQIIIAGLIAMVGWFMKRTVDGFESRLGKHETMFFQMNGDLQRITGHLGIAGRTHFRKDDLSQS